jgi:hypothetical protein
MAGRINVDIAALKTEAGAFHSLGEGSALPELSSNIEASLPTASAGQTATEAQSMVTATDAAKTAILNLTSTTSRVLSNAAETLGAADAALAAQLSAIYPPQE